MDLDIVLKDFLDEVREIFASKKAVNIYVYDAPLEKIEELVRKGYTLGSAMSSGSGIRAYATRNVVTGEFEVALTVYSDNMTLEKYLELRKRLEQ
ncbi:hypothetical protein [Geoglobus acetivorans]|uniref:Uncharacterized protein n=1 Tax=Geoglobus acetivorans TaxID=565033 RepID=A0ABZ3H4A8_GEOAI|nr:hypothetical protein [Geoglobus acetivorans]